MSLKGSLDLELPITYWSRIFLNTFVFALLSKFSIKNLSLSLNLKVWNSRFLYWFSQVHFILKWLKYRFCPCYYTLVWQYMHHSCIIWYWFFDMSILDPFCIDNPILYSITRLIVYVLYSPLTIWINEYIIDPLYRDLTLHGCHLYF